MALDFAQLVDKLAAALGLEPRTPRPIRFRTAAHGSTKHRDASRGGWPDLGMLAIAYADNLTFEVHHSWSRLTGYHKTAPLILRQPQAGEHVTGRSAEIAITA
jgi:hypothetical protein